MTYLVYDARYTISVELISGSQLGVGGSNSLMSIQSPPAKYSDIPTCKTTAAHHFTYSVKMLILALQSFYLNITILTYIIASWPNTDTSKLHPMMFT